MEKTLNLQKRIPSVRKALACLRSSLDIIANEQVGKDYYEHMRNSAIQCFEFSLDTLWKALREYLLVRFDRKPEVMRPRDVFQEAFLAGLISEDEFKDFMHMIDARNLTSHTYNEPLAEDIFKELEHFYRVMYALVERM